MKKTRSRIGDPWRSREEGSLLLASVLWIVARLRGPLIAFGVDYPIFRELLRTRILMDLRPMSGAGSAMGLTGIVIAVLMAWLTGLGTGLIALMGKEPGLWPGVQLSVLFFLLVFFLLQALVGMLIDPEDVRVLAPHPVPDRTLFAVRLVQVFAYLSLLTFGFTAGNVVLAVFAQSPLPTLFFYPVLAVLVTLVALGSVALFFTLLLRLGGPTHFQRLSLWMQVASATLLMGGMQLGPRMVPEELVERVWKSDSAWKLLWPPVQCARAFRFAAGEWTGENAIGLACALLTPALALFVTLRLASRSYVAGLEGRLDLGRPARNVWPRGLFAWLASRLGLSREQRAGFDFAHVLARREPHVLRAVLPQFVSFQAMSIAMGMGSLRHPGRGFGAGFFECYSAGLLALVLPNLLTMCQGSPVPESGWLFQATPVRDEADIVRGSVKALIAGWFGTALAVIAVVQVCVVGIGELPHIVLALELAAVLALAMTRAFALGIPFTRAVRKADGLENIGIILASLVGLLALGGLHWALSLHPIALTAGLIGAAAAAIALWRSLDRMKMSDERRLVPLRRAGG